MNRQKILKYIDQLAEVLPGIFTWLIIFAPIWVTLFSPELAVGLITFVLVFATAISILYLIGLGVGLYKFFKESNTAWDKELLAINHTLLPDQETLPKTKNGLPFINLITISVNDDYSIIKQNLDAIAKSKFPKENLLVTISLEERYPEWAKSTKKQIEDNYKEIFDNLIVTLHKQEPDLPTGAGVNRNWAAKVSEKWLKEHNIELSSVLLMTFDVDTVVSPQFLPAIAYRYLTIPNRTRKFYTTAAILFDNNAWRTHFFARIQGLSLSISHLTNWVFNLMSLEIFSVYAVNMQCLKDINYWDPFMLIDDSPTSLRLFFHYDGDFSGEAVYIPVHADCVEGTSFFRSHLNLYIQQQRWGWGTVVETKVLVRGIYEKFTKIPLLKLIPKVLNHFLKINLVTTSILLLSFGLSIIKLVNNEFTATAMIVNVSTFMKIILSLISFTALPIMLARVFIFKQDPKKNQLYRVFTQIVETPFIVVGTILFNIIPYIESQTWPLFNKRLGVYKATEKQKRA